MEEQAEWLLQEEPDYLLTYPSVVAALVEHFNQSKQRLKRLREVRTYGEVLDPHIRQLVRQHWAVPITDVYSTQEVGYVEKIDRSPNGKFEDYRCDLGKNLSQDSLFRFDGEGKLRKSADGEMGSQCLARNEFFNSK